MGPRTKYNAARTRLPAYSPSCKVCAQPHWRVFAREALQDWTQIRPSTDDSKANDHCRDNQCNDGYGANALFLATRKRLTPPFSVSRIVFLTRWCCLIPAENKTDLVNWRIKSCCRMLKFISNYFSTLSWNLSKVKAGFGYLKTFPAFVTTIKLSVCKFRFILTSLISTWPP